MCKGYFILFWPFLIAATPEFAYSTYMDGQHAADLILFLLNLIVYPVALFPLALRIFFRQEYRKVPAFRAVLRLLLYSSLFAAASSLQLFFGHMDLLLRLPAAVEEAFYQSLSILILTGAGLFVTSFPGCIRTLDNVKEAPSLAEKILNRTTRIAAGITATVFILVFIPGLEMLDTLLSVLLPVTFLLLLLPVLYSFIMLLPGRKNLNHAGDFLFLLVGDLGIILLAVLLPSGLARLFIPLFFLFHFWRLFSLLVSILKNRKDIGLSEREKADRLEAAGLSKREAEIALLLVKDYSYQAIADRSFISLSTVQTHVSRIYGKLDVNSKIGLSLIIEKLQG